MKSCLRLLIFSVFSGLLAGLTIVANNFIPQAHWLVFLCLVPLWSLWLDERSQWRIFFAGWITQFVFALVGFNWIAHTVREFSHLPWAVSFLVLAAFCALANLHIPLAGLAWRRIFPTKSPLWLRALSLAIFTGLFERFFPMIFPWNFGYVWFYKEWPGAQLADVVGISGLSMLTILANGIALIVWRSRGKTRIISSIFGCTLLVLINIAGLWREGLISTPDKMERILVVQANIGNRLKHLSEHGARFREAITEKYIAVTQTGLTGPKPDLVIWPETSFPDDISKEVPAVGARRDLHDFLVKNMLDLAVGAFGFDSSGKDTNALFFLSREGKYLAPPYAKYLLLAFGEYIPGAETFPVIKKLLPDVRDFGRGPGPSVVDLREVKFGAQICYEGVFDWFSRDLSLKGAQILLNVTNDSWYGKWQQPYQHFYITMAKAVETRLPLVRATNTGISSVALASGKILAVSPVHEEWAHTFEVEYQSHPQPTPFTRYGYWLVPLLFAFAGILFVFMAMFRERQISP